MNLNLQSGDVEQPAIHSLTVIENNAGNNIVVGYRELNYLTRVKYPAQ